MCFRCGLRKISPKVDNKVVLYRTEQNAMSGEVLFIQIFQIGAWQKNKKTDDLYFQKHGSLFMIQQFSTIPSCFPLHK